MSLQNGLDNVEKIQKKVKSDKIYVCITTHGVVFSKPGVIKHTGVGRTILGCLNNKKTGFTNDLLNCLNDSGIKSIFSNNINHEMWIKAIINSSINPVTSIFHCKNGILIKNPILEKNVEKVCEESTNIANTQGLNLSVSDMIAKTKKVINETYENHSSMLQSVMLGKKTEIDSINGKLINFGRKNCVDTSLNEILVYCVKKLGD
jgi:2-dehydropantoate 2-reductase